MVTDRKEDKKQERKKRLVKLWRRGQSAVRQERNERRRVLQNTGMQFPLWTVGGATGPPKHRSVG